MSDSNFARARLGAIAAALVLLAGCGGGGGGGSAGVSFPAVRSGTASAGADLTAQNADALSADVVRNLIAGTLGSEASPVGGTGATDVARAALQRSLVAGRRAQRQAVEPIDPADLPECLSGQVSGSVNDADNNNRPSVGDSISFVFSSCVMAPGMPAVSGGTTVRFDQLELAAGDELRAAALTMSITNLGAVGQPVVNGTVSVWLRIEANGDERMLMRFNQVTARLGNVTHVIDWDVEVSVSGATLAESSSISGQVSVGGERYALTQRAAFTGSSAQGYPTQGSVRVSDATGDRVDISATPGGVARTFGTSAGAETPLPTQPWSAFGG